MNQEVLIPGSVLASPEPGKQHVRYPFLTLSYKVLSTRRGGSRELKEKEKPAIFFVDDGAFD
jgi:hypothetical protein